MVGICRTTTGRWLLGVVLAVVVLLPLALTQFEISPHRVTLGTVVVTALLLIGTISLPALLFAEWHGVDE
ncbi:hypothetical protein [Natrialba taiwanensis]|uniref:Uncharacterized protein n=1 Tax=Natrialba taiwanensis DSM 12281 TaxID=1230458 RepID=M0A6S2_9EURY|nr:hypothetical protein [Natrialba taiwanensis]ELY94046.1 hypothetical protein C484_06469 [Natrialba taiwanensis DSM 12281]